MPDGRSWPRATVVTPSYNQGRFIEETIRSALLQGYPDLEYIVVDGSSTDESVDIIRKYADWLAYWVSEPDRGQSHAINKGFTCSTGDLLAWINSDDFLLPHALHLLAEGHVQHPDSILLGDVEHFLAGGNRSWLVRQANVTLHNLINQWDGRFSWHQAGMFVPRPLYALTGPLDEALRYAFDHDWLFRLTQRASVSYLGKSVARVRIHAEAKTTAEIPAAMQEGIRVTQRYMERIPGSERVYIRAVHRVFEASVYLGYEPRHARFWDRRAGVRHLLAAWRETPRIIFYPNFRKLCRRAVLPKWLLRSSPWKSSGS